MASAAWEFSPRGREVGRNARKHNPIITYRRCHPLVASSTTLSGRTTKGLLLLSSAVLKPDAVMQRCPRRADSLAPGYGTHRFGC
eukprot:1178866-Prorocentrum_minimum.AAC.2